MILMFSEAGICYVQENLQQITTCILIVKPQNTSNAKLLTLPEIPISIHLRE